MASVYAGKYQGAMVDLGGRALVGAKAEIRVAGTLTLATLYNAPIVIAAAGGDSLANPGMSSTGIPAAAGEGRPGVDDGAVLTFYASSLASDGSTAEYELWATYAGQVVGPFRLTMTVDPRENSPTAGLAAEASARTAADSALSSAIAAEAALRASGDTAGAVALSAAIAALSGTYAPIGETAARVAADALLVPLTQKGAASGVASLDSGGKVPSGQLPDIAISNFLGTVVSQAAMLALVGERGDWAIRSDLNSAWIIKAEPSSVLGNWQELPTPVAGVSSVNARTGAVTGLAEATDLAAEAVTARAAEARIAPVRSAAGLIFDDVLTPVTADGMGLGVGQSQHTGSPTPRYFILTGEPSSVVGQLGSDSLATYSPGAVFKAGSLAVYMAGAGGGPWSQGYADPNTLVTNEVIHGAPGVAVRSFRIGYAFGTNFRRVTQRWYKVPGVQDVLYCQVEVSLDETQASGLVASNAGNPPRINLMFESKGNSSGGQVLAYDSTLDGVSLLTSNPAAATGSTPGYIFVRSLSDPSSGHYYDDLTTPDIWQFFSAGALPIVTAPPVGLAVTPNASGGAFVAGTYYWRITYLNAVGETLGSNEVSAAVVTNGTATLTWTGPAPSGAVYVSIHRAATSGAASATRVISVLASLTTYTDPGNLGSVGTFPTTNTTGADSYTTVANRVYRAHLSVTASGGQKPLYVMRFAVGMGTTLTDAKRAVTNIPNVGPADTITHYQSRIAALPRPATLTTTEATAWDRFLATVVINERTERDWQPQRTAYDGRPRRYVFNALGRWNALWTMDTPMGLLGYCQVDPALVRDTLDHMFNHRMDQTTGFLSYDGSVSRVLHGSFLFARLALRYLVATGDTTFAATIYTKLKLMHTWWTTNAASGYRHPNWPTVKLFTGTVDVEIQEQSPVTSGGNFPSGDDWTMAMAYDFCLQMSALAAATGNSADVAGWNTTAADYKAAIQTYCWDASQGWFQPTMTAASPNGGVAGNLGKFNQVITYRAFWHLWAGTATPAQAAIMQAKIMDPLIFKGTYGIRTVDKRWAGYQADNWVNGASRPYFDAAVSLGLRRYGYTADADTVLAAWVARQNVVGTTPEATNPETGTGGYARYLLTGVMLMEAMLAKSAPTWLGGIGTSLVTS